MNHDEESPLRGIIRTPTVVAGIIKDNSVLRMLENSLSDGVLYRFRGTDSGDGDPAPMLGILHAFWSAVAEVFTDAWGVNPRRSRLMHGAGIVSVGFLMDAISDRVRRTGLPTKQQFCDDLMPLRDACRWTSSIRMLRLRAGVRRKCRHSISSDWSRRGVNTTPY